MRKKLLRMNLQNFAEGGEEEDTNPEEQGGQVDPATGDEPEDKTDREGEEKTVTMTQEEINKMISDRLARERNKQEEEKQKERDEAERKRLAENEEYKELAEKLQNQIDSQKAETMNAKKESALTQAGYTEDQITYLMDTVKGESDDDIQNSVEELAEVFTPKKKSYTDPNPGNVVKNTPENKNAEEIGHSAFERIKGKIKRN